MSLKEALDLVPDSRSGQGRRHSLGAILAWRPAPCCAVPAACRPRRCHGPSVGIHPEETPCVATLHRVFKGLNVAAFEAVAGSWLANSGVEPDDPLSLSEPEGLWTHRYRRPARGGNAKPGRGADQPSRVPASGSTDHRAGLPGPVTPLTGGMP